MTEASENKNSEQLSGISTKELLSELKRREDMPAHLDTIHELLELAKLPAVIKEVPKTTRMSEIDANKERITAPSECRPFCQTKIFAEKDSTDFIQLNAPYQIGERDDFWQKRGNDYMSHENQNPPLPCHEVNFYSMNVATRIHSSEGHVAKIKGIACRLNRPFDQIIGREIKLNDANEALKEGRPWLSSLIEQPFPIFTLGTDNAAILNRYYDDRSDLNIEVIPITASYVTQMGEVDNQVKQHLLSRLSYYDSESGQQLWNTGDLTDEGIRTISMTISKWLVATKNKPYHSPTILVKSPWSSETASRQAYLNALTGQTILHLLYPTVVHGLEINEKTNLKPILTKLPSFSTSPIRYSNITMLSEKEYQVKSGFSYGQSQILTVDTSAIHVGSQKIERELHRLKNMSWQQALQEWRKSVTETCELSDRTN